MSRTGAFQADEKETSSSSVGNLLMGNTMLGMQWQRELRLARIPGWWDLVWISYIDKRFSLMCPAKIMAYNSPARHKPISCNYLF